MRNARGLSLIELLVTVGMMSTAAALVIPSMNSTGVLRVQAAARTVVADITLAQTEAMAFQVRRGVYFGAVPDGNGSFKDGNGYVVTEPTTQPLEMGNLSLYALTLPENSSSEYARDFDNQDKYAGAQLKNATFDGAPALLFDELGAPVRMVASGDGSPTQVLDGNGGSVNVVSDQLAQSYTVTVDAMTGRVNIVKVEAPEPEDD